MHNKLNNPLLSLIACLLVSCLFSNHSAHANSSTPADAIQANKQCETSKWRKAQLIELKTNQFKLEDNQQRDALALQLLNCLASPDPVLRDGVAYEAISSWLRKTQLSQPVMLQMFNRLAQVIEQPLLDPQGIYKPFAALVMSEMIRAENQASYISATQLAQIVNAMTQYLSQLTDFRGFNDQSGWRHGVAHSADVLLHLAMNKRVNKSQLNQMLTALQQKISPAQQHYYIFGEPKRMAIAAVYLFLRDEQTIEDWQKWLSDTTEPAPLAKWSEAYQSEAGLAKLHNTQQFLSAFYVLIKSSQNDKLQQMVPALEEALKRVN